MRLLTYLFVFITAVVLTSCLTIEEKISLNKDGSGTFQTFIDMGGVLSNPMLAEGVKKGMEETGGMGTMQVDSIMDIYTDLAAQNPQWTDVEHKLMQRVESRINVDFEKAEGGVYINFDFADLAELRQMQMLMSASKDEATDAPNGMAGIMGGGPLTGIENEFKWKKGLFERTATSAGNIMDALNLGDEDAAEEMMNGMKMMMGDAKVVYIMEFPGKVKKVTGFPGHSIENDNQLVQEFSFLDVLDDPSLIDEGLDGSVKFKKK
jgi:hypothetical protein